MEQCSWIASLHEFGRIFGALGAGFFLETYSRRNTLITTSIFFFLLWPPVIFVRQILLIYCIRFVLGMAVGMNDTCSTIYLGENSSPEYRGIFGSVSIAFYYAGILFEFVLASYLPYNTTAITNSVITFLALFGTYTLKESPQYLILKKKYEKAESNFYWLKGTNENREDFAKLRQIIQEENANKLTFKKLATTSLYYKPVLIVLVLCMLVMLSGFASVTSFVSIAFSESLIFTPNQFTILFGLLQLITACISPFFIEKYNRRSIMTIAFLLAAVAHGCTAILFFINENISSVPYFSYLIFITITSYSMVFSGGIHGIYFSIRSELFPQNVKEIGSSVTIIGQSLVGFLSSKIFLYLSDMYGVYMNFVVFFIVCIFGVIYVYFFLPETRGKTLAEIQESFNLNKLK
ncbi:hypothetical protein PGB90_001402 [Kerria lacca]